MTFLRARMKQGGSIATGSGVQCTAARGEPEAAPARAHPGLGPSSGHGPGTAGPGRTRGPSVPSLAEPARTDVRQTSYREL